MKKICVKQEMLKSSIYPAQSLEQLSIARSESGAFYECIIIIFRTRTLNSSFRRYRRYEQVVDESTYEQIDTIHYEVKLSQSLWLHREEGEWVLLCTHGLHRGLKPCTRRGLIIIPLIAYHEAQSRASVGKINLNEQIEYGQRHSIIQLLRR